MSFNVLHSILTSVIGPAVDGLLSKQHIAPGQVKIEVLVDQALSIIIPVATDLIVTRCHRDAFTASCLLVSRH